MDFRKQARRILKVYRAENDLTQMQLAAKCGVSMRTYVKIEQGKEVGDDTLNMVLEAVGYRLKVEISRTIEKIEG